MRKFDHNTTWDDVKDMTAEEAIAILSRDANSDGSDWTARPHRAKAAQMAIEALQARQPLDEKYLADWFVNATDGSKPVWTKAHVNELVENFDVFLKPSAVSSCSYCEGDEAIAYTNNENCAFVDSHGEMLVTAHDRSIRFKVRFCPMCGKKFG